MSKFTPGSIEDELYEALKACARVLAGYTTKNRLIEALSLAKQALAKADGK